MNYFFNEKYFYITNDLSSSDRAEVPGDKYYLFGHCFTENDILKDKELTKSEFDYIRKNHERLSGLFVCIGIISGKIEVFVDPLVQYPVFYYKENGVLAISNKVSMLAKCHYSKPSLTFLFDYMVYRGPLRGLTPVDSIKMLRFDDLQFGSGFSLDCEELTVHKTSLLFKKDLSYEEALTRLAQNIKTRASIIANKFNYIECALSGGIDCRIVASAFLDYDNVYYYSLGFDSQDRLCFEALTDKFELNKLTEIKYYGRAIQSVAYRARMIDDLNGIKLHSYGGYMNYGRTVGPQGCRLTGYFGEYIGHKLPFGNISPKDGTVIRAPHIDNFPMSVLKEIEEYSVSFWNFNARHDRFGESEREINQLFYINSRGVSHFGMNSVSDNRYINSFNILYDPVALRVSELSPYTDNEDDKGATCIDLICKISGPEFALFPYESRKIPKYRNFDYVPEFNCFERHVFEHKELEPIKKVNYAMPEIGKWDMLKIPSSIVRAVDILNQNAFDDFFDDFPYLIYLRSFHNDKLCQMQQEVLCNFLLCNHLFSKVHADFDRFEGNPLI